MPSHLFITDCHANPEHNNDRADWLGKLIFDLRPDVVVNGGDTADMSSLCSYDRGKRSFQGRTYSADISSHNDFQSRLWSPYRRAKKKLPRRITLIGNHEQRIDRDIDLQPELDGVVSYKDLDLERYYDTIVPYSGSTPGGIIVDGIYYAHYLVSGISGRPIGGENSAASILSKRYTSCCVGHSHLVDWSVKTRADGKKIMGLVGGCMIDYDMSYAGDSARLWWRGVTLLQNVEDGQYDPKFISLKSIKKEYSKKK